MSFTDVPEDFGQGGANIGDGKPMLVEFLTEHKEGLDDHEGRLATLEGEIGTAVDSTARASAATAQTTANGAATAAAAAQSTANTANADNLVHETIVAVATNTITFVGLDGDLDGGYEFEYTGAGVNNLIKCFPNNIVPVGDGSDFSTMESHINLPYWFVGDGKGIAMGRINTRTGGKRMFFASTVPLNDDGTLVDDMRQLIGVWNDTAVKVTSLVFVHQSANGFTPGCRLSIRKISH